MLTLYTPATGFPDLEIKIAYGLARVGIEAFGIDKVSVHSASGFYMVTIDVDSNESVKLDKSLNLLCRRLLSSSYIPSSTPGIAGGSAEGISISQNDIFALDTFKSIKFVAENKGSENVCRHKITSVGNVIGFSASTSYHHTRDILDVKLQPQNPKDKTSPKIPRRPTQPKSVCKICAVLSLLGTWYASFMFSMADRQVIAIPIPKNKVDGIRLQEIYALQHQIRKNWINQEIPQVIIPLILLSKIPSSADILEGFDLFVAVLSRPQAYRVDGLFLIPIEKYLNFIRHTPYNVATIDIMLRKNAFGSLQELNNVIYNRDKSSTLKFPRLYVQETSTNNFTNRLYPETAKYLLKEVAMIRQEIIENDALQSLARTLRYFIMKKKYGYADDIRNARKDSRDFEETIAKMLREGRLRLEQKERIHLPTDEEIKEIFRLANEDYENTKAALVILAFSFPSGIKEEDIEPEAEASNEGQ